MRTEPFHILSLDGGGPRGIVTAAILAELQSISGQDLADHFDLMVGTSTGAIIVMGLGLGIDIGDIATFYAELMPRIFSGSQRLGDIRRIFISKHDPAQLLAALTSVFGNRTMYESSKRLAIPAYNLTRGTPHIFRTGHSSTGGSSDDLSAVDVLMAATAAPTYLPSYKIHGLDLIDGGLWAHNPEMMALVEATNVCGAALSKIRILSLGNAGRRRQAPNRLANGGLLSWSRAGPPVMRDAQCSAVSQQARDLLPEGATLRIDAATYAPSARRWLSLAEARRIAAVECRRATSALACYLDHRSGPFR